MDTRPNNTPNQYLKTKVMTASPEELQLMLYDGAIRFCEQARELNANGDLEKRFTLISKAEKIIMELMNSMKDEYAPEICSRMRSLYLFCYERLIDANLQRETRPLDEALKIIRHIRETWVLLMEKIKEENGQIADIEVATPEELVMSGAGSFSVEG